MLQDLTSAKLVCWLQLFFLAPAAFLELEVMIFGSEGIKITSINKLITSWMTSATQQTIFVRYSIKSWISVSRTNRR